MLTREERERLRALEREATHSPWKHDTVQSESCVVSIPRLVVPWRKDEQAFDDARLIAAARNALIPLLDHIDALEARLASLSDDAARLCEERSTAFRKRGFPQAAASAGWCADAIRAASADPTAQVEPCNGCGEPNDDGCDHCCQTCLGSEVCPSCGVLAKEVEDE